MKNLLPLLLEICLSAVVVLIAFMCAMPFRRKIPEPVSLKTSGGVAGLFLHYAVRPFLVLVVTACGMLVVYFIPPLAGWAAMVRPHVVAWVVFWLVLLGLALVETVAILFFAVQGKSFPIPALLRNIGRFLIYTAAAFAVLKYVLHVNISPLLASTALVTAVVGFALQGVLGNLLAGMSLHVTRSVIPGDWVAIDTVEGEVTETNWRETRIRTVGGHVKIIPNSTVASSVIHNMTRPDSLRRHIINIGASYSDAPADVIEALVEAALAVPDVMREPAPSAFLTEYKDFGINYVLRFWSNQYYNRTPVEGDVNRMIWYQFKRRGIEIPFPMSDKLLNDFMDVVYTQRRLAADDTEIAKRAVSLQESDFGTKILVDEKGQPLLTSEEWKGVANMAKRARYTRGEILFRQGDPGSDCYVLVKGVLTGSVGDESGAHRHTFELEAGRVVGEMSLMTGLPRTATIQAKTEVDVLQIQRDAFIRLLSLRKEIPELLAKLVAERAEKNKAAFESLKSMAKVNVSETLRRDNILSRFLRLLGRG